MSRLRLLKMLYMGDRRLLSAVGVPITRDTIYAMDNGPVLARVYDLIKGKDSALPLWSKYIRNAGSQDLVLIREPGVGCLSEFEVDTLNRISDEFREIDDWKVAEVTRSFAEWQKNKPPEGSRRLISLHDMLEAIGIPEMEEPIRMEAEMEAVVDDALAQHEP